MGLSAGLRDVRVQREEGGGIGRAITFPTGVEHIRVPSSGTILNGSPERS